MLTILVLVLGFALEGGALILDSVLEGLSALPAASGSVLRVWLVSGSFY